MVGIGLGIGVGGGGGEGEGGGETAVVQLVNSNRKANPKILK